MRKSLNALSDRVLGLFVPRARAGACACGPWDGGWYEYRCYLGQDRERRWCYWNCYCVKTCGAWQYLGDC